VAAGAPAVVAGDPGTGVVALRDPGAAVTTVVARPNVVGVLVLAAAPEAAGTDEDVASPVVDVVPAATLALWDLAPHPAASRATTATNTGSEEPRRFISCLPDVAPDQSGRPESLSP
jgi:hypothetical protein